MKVTFLPVGKLASGSLRAATDDYTQRLSHYLPFEVDEVPDVRATRGMSQKQQKEAEGRNILSRLSPGDFVVLLDERGREMSSTEFAQFMQKRMSSGGKRLVFVVGGPYGFSDDVYARADSKMSLSKMTFPHELVRLIFTEQLYRAMTILRGEPYHHQ